MITHSKYPCKRCSIAKNCIRTQTCPKWTYWFIGIWQRLQREADYLRGNRK